MKKLILGLLLLFSAPRAVDTLSVPTDFLSVTTGTRANLSGNFTAIQTWGNKVRDSIAQVTARLSGYSGNLAITSLSNLRLKLDGDNSETARLLVESGNGDSLFSVREDTTARFYRHLTVDSNLTVGKNLTVTGTSSLATLSTSGTGSLASLSVSGTSALTGAVTNTVLAGTGTRLVTATSSGILGNSLNINGAYEFLNAIACDKNLSWADVTGTTTTASIWRDATNGMNMRGVNASSNDLGLWSASGSLILNNPTGTTSVTFPGTSVSIAGTATTTGKHTFTAAPRFSSVNASEFLLVDASKDLTSVASTGSGSVVRATSPSISSPTITSPSIATSLTASYATASTAAEFDGSKNLVSVTKTGTGNDVYSASPTLTGTVSAAAITASGTITADTLVSSKFYAEGTFTATMTGVTPSATGTVQYARAGRAVTLTFPQIVGTSNANTFTMTGLPAGLCPASNAPTFWVPLYDNTVGTSTKDDFFQVGVDCVIRFSKGGSSTGWTASGTKGLYNSISISYVR